MKKVITSCLLLLSAAAPAVASDLNWEELLRKSVATRLPPNARMQIRSLKAKQIVSKSSRIVSFSPEIPLGLVWFETEDGTGNRAQGSAVIQAFAPIAIAKHSLNNGEKLSADSVRFEERELNKFFQSGYFTDASEINQHRVRGFVLAGQALNRSNSEPLPLVSAGQTVDLVSRRKGLRIAAKVRAMQKGGLDQWVQVLNPGSKKIVLARVVGPAEVETK